MKKILVLMLSSLIMLTFSSCSLLLPLAVLKSHSTETEYIETEREYRDTDGRAEMEELSESVTEERLSDTEDSLHTDTEEDESLIYTEAEETEAEESRDEDRETEGDTETESETESASPPRRFDASEAHSIIGEAALYYTVGEDRYDIDCDAYLLEDSTLEDYRALVVRLQGENLIKYSDNGESGIDGQCYQTTLYDGDYTVNVTYYGRTSEIYMTVEEYRQLSPYQIAPVTAVRGDATTFHMPEMPTVNGSYKFGECEIFRLSNGHFVIVDGAQEFSAELVVEYLEALTPNGSTPVVDAWFLTHAHPDHAYCVWGIGRDDELVARINVEGFYYTWPCDEGMRKESDYEDLLLQVSNVNGAIERFRTSAGESTPKYKLHAGMRFYFEELEVQVLFTQDQMMPSEYGNGFNDSSTSFKFIAHMMYNGDVSFLIMGDASEALCDKIMDKYSADTLHTEFFQSLHHGNNDAPEFFRYIKPDYLNYTYKNNDKGKNKEGYRYLASTCKGVYCSPTVIDISRLKT